MCCIYVNATVLNRLIINFLSFISASLNEVSLLVDTRHLKRFGLWKSKDEDHSKRCHAILFLWVSSNYLQEIQTQLENSILSQPCKYKKISEFQNNLKNPINTVIFS
jgi:sentrin-specific protease 7